MVWYFTTMHQYDISPHNAMVVWYFATIQWYTISPHNSVVLFRHTMQWWYDISPYNPVVLFCHTMKWYDISPWYDILRSSEACQRGSCGTVKPFNSIGWHCSSKSIAVELINYFEVRHDLSHTSIIREWYIYSMRNLDDTFTKKRSQDILG
jgi:hypothetical protein